MTGTNTTTQPRTLSSIRQTSDELGLSRSTVYALLGEGRLTAVKLGKRTLIPRDSIAAFVGSLPHARFTNSAAKPAASDA